MSISKYLSKMRIKVPMLSRMTGIPAPTIYRWVDEEERGQIPDITSTNLKKLVDGTGGQLTANAILGIKKSGKAA
jgi:hypothetical protein